MNTLVIDASIAIKWVVEEDGTDLALALRQKARLMAPDLIVAECANILWKKVQRKELSKDEALSRLACFRARRLNWSRLGRSWSPQHGWQLSWTIGLTIASTWLWRLRTVADLSLPMNVSSTRFGGIRKARFVTVLWAYRNRFRARLDDSRFHASAGWARLGQMRGFGNNRNRVWG